MSNFDLLHPAIQHHIVNSLGWRSLRPLQSAAIPPILGGEHAILLAPTAGGKTEAAVFPVLSRMLTEPWDGLSVLYICPIKALLNNLEPRLDHYAGLVGRRVARWHGDVSPARKAKLVAEPPDLLLTTPESLEVTLISRRVDHWRLFAALRCVIVDEIHAFAGDDRGWHLLYLLERLSRIAGRELQRLGLSATVGNPEQLCDWLAGGAGANANPDAYADANPDANAEGGADAAASNHAWVRAGAGAGSSHRVINPPTEVGPAPEVELDWVGNLRNAALVISRLHRGEKRLVFCDSRARVEELAVELRALGVNTFVSHSCLSLEERRAAEMAFSQGQDCVIVATSTLELGIDVGDLDRVIQIDAQGTVASFLQRIGRTGRRAGTARNCLFLITKEEAFLPAAALLQLWSEGFVEPIEPPALPLHLFAQQIMGLTLQESGMTAADWPTWLGRRPGLERVELGLLAQILDFMHATEILHADQGLMGIGQSGERQFGAKHFMALFSVFVSPPSVKVFHGRQEIGEVHQSTFILREEGPAVLTLAGRSWATKYVDWPRHKAYVEPTELRGRSQWLSAGQPLQFALCQAVARVLARDDPPVAFSRRALEHMDGLREVFDWVEPGKTFLIAYAHDSLLWWTFSGRLMNAAIANALAGEASKVSADNLAISFSGTVDLESLKDAIAEKVLSEHAELKLPLDEDFIAELKFSECLPPAMRELEIAARYDCSESIAVLRHQPLETFFVSTQRTR
ncbi:MAG: DEAD/DEAH box helicase [Lamprobacter sp.]|uniref:DEAD/DEAH box helicase n=1 Tax=Lamprobacter sp. TaxID=3100796 RepID=UPI002B25A998|nr:DEAD/DEAH box helicase [Lamprobacter sp.]MEA3641936.1 DEAD/DEAH box helicase [Lamprobacter sp.]